MALTVETSEQFQIFGDHSELAGNAVGGGDLVLSHHSVDGWKGLPPHRCFFHQCGQTVGSSLDSGAQSAPAAALASGPRGARLADTSAPLRIR